MAFTYRGLKAEYDRHIVTPEEIHRQLERLQQQSPRIELVENRPTQTGDEVVLDYAGFCDGVQFPGGTAEKQTLVLGSGTFIPGFEEQLLDKVVGEEVSVKVMFPAQYHAPDLAGKAAEFKCKIHEIRIKSTYELDDTFAKEVGGCETLEEMRRKLGESMQAYADERAEMDLQDRLLRQAAATLDYTPTDVEMEEALDQHMKTMEAQLAQQGLSLEMYCSFLGTDEATLREEARATAEASLRSAAAVDKIVELEGLTADAQEIDEAVELVCRQNEMTLEQIKPYYNAEFEAAIIRSVLTSKALRLIRDAATIAVTE